MGPGPTSFDVTDEEKDAQFLQLDTESTAFPCSAPARVRFEKLMELGFPKPGDVESRLGHCVGQLGTWRAGTQAEGIRLPRSRIKACRRRYRSVGEFRLHE